ncbi:MAG TPA: ABC transporter permease [Thermoleophilia bacterium]|nr:ABC transporter permease [Thermoleophilia bacterium]
MSHTALVAAIVRKDLREFSRDRLWLILTIVGLVMFIAVFWMLPGTVDETIRVGVTPPDLAETLLGLSAGEGEVAPAQDDAEGQGPQEGQATQGLEVVRFDSEEDLRAVVAGEAHGPDVAVGLAFPGYFAGMTERGEPVTVTVYVESGVPAEVRQAMESAVREIVYFAAGAAEGVDPMDVLPVRQETVVLGEDRAGEQVSMRERMRPLLAFFVLMMESLALAGLIAVEIQRRTVTALLVTPASLTDVLAAKSVLGTTLAFSEAVLMLALTRSFGAGWSVLLAAALLGAVIVTGMALISGAAGKDFMGTLFLSMVLLVPLAIPAVTVLFPGSTATWVKALPTYGVMEAFVRVTSYGESWAELWGPLALAALWCVAVFGAGLLVLRRKVRTL